MQVIWSESLLDIGFYSADAYKRRRIYEKTLAGCLREYKRGSILTILLSILEAAFESLILLLMACRLRFGKKFLKK